MMYQGKVRDVYPYCKFQRDKSQQNESLGDESQQNESLGDKSQQNESLGDESQQNESLGDKSLGDKSNEMIIIHHSDRLSAFDRIWCQVPRKGEWLNKMSAWWFEKTRHIVPNHFVRLLNDTDMLVRKCTVFPVEVVVRGYCTGTTKTSLWTVYESGTREYCGNVLPEGLVKDQKLPKPIITPTTKGETDEPITPDEIIARKIMNREQWNYVAEKALQLFEYGTQVAAQVGLVLVDTKYEFGYLVGDERSMNEQLMNQKPSIILVDELHTCDSSRWWYNGKNLDKEQIRKYIKSQCDPYSDDDAQKIIIPDEMIEQLSKSYEFVYNIIEKTKL